MSHFVGYGYESNQCSDDDLTGFCDGFIPNDEAHPGDYCVCKCHDEGLTTIEQSMEYHSDKHRDAQDGAYHNIGYVRSPAVESDDMPGIRYEAMVERILDNGYSGG